MLRSTLVAALLAGLALATTPARAQNVTWSVTVGSGGALGAYVGVPGAVIAPPVAVYPSAPVYSPTVVVAAPRVYPPPRVAYPRPAVWVGPRVRAYPVVLPVYGGGGHWRGHWRGHGHRH